MTRDVPGFFHFDSIGFFRLPDGKKTLPQALDELLNMVRDGGGNILLPVYSYSYTKKEDFSIRETPSDLGRVSDHLRLKNFNLRTTDALFSYLSFGQWVPSEFFEPRDYDCFGVNSLIARGLDADGYLMSVGGKLHQCTEVHHLEKILGISYRMDKVFSGNIVTLDGQKHPQRINYFCRDLEFAEKYNATVSFERLFKDMDEQGLIERRNIDGNLEIEFVRYQRVYSFLQKKLPMDPFYLMKDKTTSGPVKG